MTKLYDVSANTSNVEEVRDQQRKRNELPGIHLPNRPCLCAVNHVTQLAGKKSLHLMWSVGSIANAPYPPKYLFIFRADTFLIYFIFWKI